MKKIIALTLSLLLLIPIFTVASSALDFAPSPKASSYVENRLLIEIAEPENESNICRLDSIYNFVEYKTVFEHDEAETDKDTVYCVTFADSYDVCEVKREIEEYSFVKSVSLDYIGEFCGVVDDSSAEAVASKSWYFNDLNVKDAWDACDKKDNEVVVAVIDSGFDVDNPAIHDSLVPLTSNNETYYCYNAATQTYGDPGAENHGTAVASTIVAQTQNTAINGIASNLKNGDGKNLVKVLAICIADQADSTMTVSALIRAFDFLNKYVADGSNHVDIVSLSLSFTVDERNAMLSPDEIDELGGIISIISENFIVIAAAGNDMQSTSENASYPAQLSDVIGVMGYDIDGKLWKELDWDSPLENLHFYHGSNFDTSADMKCFDIAAPSQFVFTYSENQIEEVVWGTSVAAPLVSGVVALYISQNPDWYYGNTVNKTQAMKAILKEKLTRDLEYEYNGVTYSVPKLSASDMLVEEPQNPAYSGSLGSAAAWNYDSLSKKLTISGAGSLPDFQSSVSVPWYAYRKEIESAEVLNTDNNNGITNIPAFAFSHCEKITAVSLPSSVTHIGSHAFDTCRSLASISDTSNVAEIESFAFCNCSKLQGLSFSDGYTVVNDGTFMTCSSLNTFSLANITEIGDLAFAGCEGYNKTSAEVDYIDITDAVSIGKLAFAYCNTISNLKISSEVQALKYGTFWHCKSLLSIIIPNISAIEDYCFQANPHTNITVLGKVESAGDVSLNTDFLYVLNDIVSMADWAIAFGKVYCLPDTNISAYADSKGLNKEYLMQPINENCVIDRDLKLIYGLDAPLLQSKLFTEVLDVNVDYETVKAGTLRVGTGYKIILKDHNGNVLDEYTIIIFGDLNSDGSVNAKDASILAEIVSGIKPLPDGSAYYYAGDLTNFGDGLTQEDYEYLRQVINGTIELLQTPNYETVNN